MKRKEYEKELEPLQVELNQVARWLEHTGKRLVVLFEGRDTAGKGGTINAIAQTLNPRQTHIAALAKPSEREQGQWYFQRYVPHLPAAGEITLSGSHLVLCTGADTWPQPLPALPLHQIRGQTSLAACPDDTPGLRCGLSANSYVSPAYQQRCCFGASFVPHDPHTDWRPQEDEDNRRALAGLAPQLSQQLGATQAGHTALRADCHDHLPAVGPLGDVAAMQQQYAKLADDKKYPLDTPCPYLDGVFVNTGHGSRGLSSAPVCAELVAAQILGLPLPLPPEVAAAIAPNRLPIREIVYLKNQRPGSKKPFR